MLMNTPRAALAAVTAVLLLAASAPAHAASKTKKPDHAAALAKAVATTLKQPVIVADLNRGGDQYDRGVGHYEHDLTGKRPYVYFRDADRWPRAGRGSYVYYELHVNGESLTANVEVAEGAAESGCLYSEPSRLGRRSEPSVRRWLSPLQEVLRPVKRGRGTVQAPVSKPRKVAKGLAYTVNDTLERTGKIVVIVDRKGRLVSITGAIHLPVTFSYPKRIGDQQPLPLAGRRC
jgi:hypothetical protein